MNDDSPRLSLAMIVKDEARCLGRCLDSVRHVVQEIVVVDTGSRDASAAIARECGARVAEFAWSQDFAAARNHALELTTGDWILVLDADEHASPNLAREIAEFVRGPRAVGRLRIVSDFRRGGQTLRSQSFVSRLFPRGARFEGRIHEQIVSPLPRRELQHELWHDGYLERDKSARNVGLLERELSERPDSGYHLFQLAVEYASLGETPRAAECLRRARAALRGDEPYAANVVVDLLYALMETKAFEEALGVIDASEVLGREFPDYHLVCGLFYMELVRSDPGRYIQYLPEIEKRFRRCLQLGETTRYKSVAGTGSYLAWYNLGTLYHVFEEPDAAHECFAKGAALGHEPCRSMLAKLRGSQHPGR